MRKALVAGNWKMHGSLDFLRSYLREFEPEISGISVEVAILPPYVYLGEIASQLQKMGCAVGSQDIAAEKSGAFTGEVSGEMLVDVGCKYTLVGHSERRALYGESNDVVATKFVAAHSAGLTPVLCVGETLQQREEGNTLDIIRAQLDTVQKVVGVEKLASSVIAYEPVWAIGTGKTATPEQAQEIHRAIRGYLGESGKNTRILYGGSVKASNAEALFSQPDIDGGLVGGASLDAKEFAAICSKAERF